MIEPKSAKEYSDILINQIIESESTVPEDQKTDPILLEHWFSLIRSFCEEVWTLSICGKRDSFLITENEMMDLFNKAGRAYVSELIDDMVDEDILQASIGQDGDILYGLTSKGKEMSRNFKNKKDE